VWHDGKELSEGVKYLLRTDVMYVRDRDFDFETLYRELGNKAKGSKALGVAEGLEDAGRERRWGGIRRLLGCGLA